MTLKLLFYLTYHHKVLNKIIVTSIEEKQNVRENKTVKFIVQWNLSDVALTKMKEMLFK
jgi:hypothetical protein